MELAIGIISGAGVGWITNAVAVNMLFKKYGKWGGVIEEQYEDFIENMSQLVEADLVNPKTLQEEFNTPSFKAALHIWIKDILCKELPEKSGTIRFEEIPGIEQSIDHLIALITGGAASGLTDRVYGVFKRKEIQSLVSKEQYDYLINANIETILSSQHDLKAILYEFIEGRRINTLISQEAIDRITENISASIHRIDFSQFDGDLDKTWDTLLQVIDIDPMIGELERSLGQMRFADFIKDSKVLSQELISRIIEFSKTPEGQNMTLEIARALLEEAKTIQLKISDVLSPGIKVGIAKFINEKLPDIIDKIADFINNTGDEIEQIINDTVNRHLATSSSGIYLMSFKDIFIGDLAKRYNVVNQIVSAIYKYGDGAKNRLAHELLFFIETHTIGSLIAILQDQKLLTPQGIVTLINFNLQEMPNKNYNMIEKLLYTKIADNFKPDLSKIKNLLLLNLFKKLKNDYLYQDTFKKDLQAKLTAKIAEMQTKTCGGCFSSEDIPLGLHEQSLKQTLLNLWDSIAVKNIGAVISENQAKNFRLNWKSFWNRYKHQELNQVYQVIQKDAVYTKIAAEILELLTKRLDAIVTGNVSKLVNNELKKSSPAQIRIMAQDFMGKELKPINMFGAFLGGIAGGLSVGAAYLLGTPRAFTWWLLLLYGGIFAVVGIGTNWLAIKMLFRPYKKIIFDFSPFIGVVGARKPEFAKNISKFVQERTLNETALTEFFSKNKNNVREKILRRITKSDYAVIDSLLKNDQRRKAITDCIFSAMQAYIDQHSSAIADSIAKLLKDLITSGKINQCLHLVRDGIIQKLHTSDLAAYIHTFIKKEIEDKKLGHYTDKLSNFVDLQLNTIFKTLVNEITEEKIKQYIYQQNDWFVSYISTHSFEDFAGPQVTIRLAQGISEKIREILHTSVGPIVKYIEDKEFSPDAKLGELFNGNVSGLIEKHITYFLDLISQEIGTQKNVLIKQIKDAMPWYAAPAKGHVPPIVHLLIDEELPKFLRKKKAHILSITNPLLEYRLSYLGFTQDTLNSAMIEQSVLLILNTPQVQQKVSRFVQVIVDRYTQVPLKSILGMLNITTVQDMVSVIEPLLNPAVSYIKRRILQDDISALTVNFTKNVIEKIADTIAVSDLFAGIDFEPELRRLVAPLLEDKTAMDAVSSLLTSILLKIVKDGDFYSDGILRKDLSNFITTTLEQDWDPIKRAGIPLVETVLKGLNQSITTETKQAVFGEYCIPAVLDAGENHFKDMIHSIDIQKVVEQEVNNMHPKEIETLFNKFAGTYFIKITIYGWIGAFGGLLSYIIGCLLGWFM
jgi:uncharacterized membrane protein YheB (UPF0754 family)